MPEAIVEPPLTPDPPSSQGYPSPSSKPSTATLVAPTYHFSPHTFRRTQCGCISPRRPFITAQEAVDYMLGRLDKAWRRMTGDQRVPRLVELATSRTCHELRTRGYELTHLVVCESPIKYQGEKKRKEFSVLFLIPDPNEVIRHRALAQVLVHAAVGGRHSRTIENVAVRFGEDWEDWIVVQPHVYCRDITVAEPMRIDIPLNGTMSGRMVLGKMWMEVLRLIEGNFHPSGEEFVARLTRGLETLEHDGLVVCGFDAEKVFRKSVSGKHQSLAIRIALYTKKIIEVEEEDEGSVGVVENGGQQGQQETSDIGEKRPIEQETEAPHVGAVCLIDTSGKGQQARVKHIAIVYTGEWPLAHHYRTAIPRPNVDELERYLKK